MAFEGIPHRLLDQAKARPTSTAYAVRRNGQWITTDWKTYAEQVTTAARALHVLGLKSGDNVAILGFNRPEWVILDVATMMLGGAPAGIYTTSSPEQVHYIVDHCNAPVVLVENQEQWDKVAAVRDRLPNLRHIVLMEGTEIDDPQTLSWSAFMAKASEAPENCIEEALAAIDPAALATLIYTSGTTGPPKGVMLSHENLAWTATQAIELVGIDWQLSTLSYLPLSHIAEQVFTIHGPITAGYPVYFADSIENLLENLVEVQPGVFFGVPRVWEKMHGKVAAKLALATGFKKTLVTWAMGVGRAMNDARNASRAPSPMLSLQYALANKLIFSKVKQAMGLGKAKVCISGAAPIAGDILAFFAGLDIVIHEVYGQSENCGPTTFNRPGATRYGTVGQVFPGGELRIEADPASCGPGEGEICYRGPNVFLGYYRNEEATAETVVDAWLHSGDIGKIDADGYLTITGRKKEILITAGGKNVAPKNIEAGLKGIDVVNEAVVIGDRRPYLTALLTLDPEAAEAFASAHGLTLETLAESDALRSHIQKHIDTLNTSLSRVESIKRFTVLPRNLSIDEGELTPTLKVKRNVVNAHFEEVIEGMYA